MRKRKTSRLQSVREGTVGHTRRGLPEVNPNVEPNGLTSLIHPNPSGNVAVPALAPNGSHLIPHSELGNGDDH
jgi:hypothetical protein